MITSVHSLPIEVPATAGPLPQEAAEAIAALLLVSAETNGKEEQDGLIVADLSTAELDGSCRIKWSDVLNVIGEDTIGGDGASLGSRRVTVCKVGGMQ